jgi:hypothetical protein
MEMFMDESRIQSKPAAIHNSELFGMSTNAAELRMAPIKK